MRPLLATLVLLLVSGCISDAPSQGGSAAVAPEPTPEAPAAPSLPDAFVAERRFDSQAIQVGGIRVNHEFRLATPASLHLVFAAVVPEGVVRLEVLQGNEVVFSELVPAPLEGAERDVTLEPGSYTASAQVFGYGTLKSFRLSGSFTAA